MKHTASADPAYTAWKISHHQDRLDMLRKGEHPAPVLVQLILTNQCNSRCTFCAFLQPPYRDRFNINDVMPCKKVGEILCACSVMGVKAIEFTGGGEPTLSEDITTSILQASVLEMDVGVATNGIKMSSHLLNVLTCMYSKWVRFSVNAGTRETYRKVHGVDKFDQVIGNIKALVDRREGKYPTIGVSYIVTPGNLGDILAAVNLAKDIGVDYLRLSACYTSKGDKYYDGILESVTAICEEATEQSTEDCRIISQFTARHDDLNRGCNDLKSCGHQRFNTWIGADLCVYRCCETAYTNLGLLADLYESPFNQAWYNERVKHSMNTYRASQCYRCPFYAKNKYIEYLLEKDPLHVNFT